MQVPIHLSSSVLRTDRISAEVSEFGYSTLRHEQLPDGTEMDRIHALAKDWTRDTLPGLAQVEAICRRLREDYVCDRTAAIPAESTFPVAHFLFESRCGPDYQFATAAAVMLRSLGYSTRVVSGFYADPAAYDERLRHTPVMADDVHFWAEVYIGMGDWLTVEATPGYEVLAPPAGFWGQVRAAGLAAVQWIGEHIVLAAALIASVIAGWRSRWFLLDWLQTQAWFFMPHRCDDVRLERALRILERRLKWSGEPRPAGITPRQWLLNPRFATARRIPESRDGAAGAEQEPLEPFLQLVERAVFGCTGDHDDSPSAEVRQACSRALKAMTWRLLNPPRGPGWRERLLRRIPRRGAVYQPGYMDLSAEPMR